MHPQPLRKEVIVREDSHSDPIFKWVLLVVLYPYLWLFVGYLSYQLQSPSTPERQFAERPQSEEVELICRERAPSFPNQLAGLNPQP